MTPSLTWYIETTLWVIALITSGFGCAVLMYRARTIDLIRERDEWRRHAVELHTRLKEHDRA